MIAAMDKRVIDRGSYSEGWMRDPDMYCPKCGTQAVWVRVDDDDYITPDNCAACVRCGVQFGYPNISQFPVIHELT